MRRACAALLLVVVALLAGCGTGRGQSPHAAPRLDAGTTVQVTNHHWATVAVYLVRQGARTRIGTVTSMTSELLRVPNTLLPGPGSVHLAVDPIGSRQGYTTPPIHVSPGQIIQFQIENHLPISSVSVFHR